ncbi:hypothetical protein AVEN_120412-1 [Araneus ventricosus]|uniref:Uncharacterized protein n=1 Tax=Araneus ventricosus TaxID=182803 RepID=A0A4Y2MV04_ARAVE|nr:hypothetical protein AVEN_120412-1 [Araneus ventricosus]
MLFMVLFLDTSSLLKENGRKSVLNGTRLFVGVGNGRSISWEILKQFTTNPRYLLEKYGRNIFGLVLVDVLIRYFYINETSVVAATITTQRELTTCCPFFAS